MLLDDLHWADDASLDWLQSLQLDRTLPLTLVMAARPELLERRPDWGQALPAHRRFDLTPLDTTQRRAMTGALLQRLGDAAPLLHELIERQAEGNPFYAEELVKMLIDEGVIDSQSEPWQLRAERLDPARVPSTLTGVLQARLGALAASERRAL